jgi:hypothetical protein
MSRLALANISSTRGQTLNPRIFAAVDRLAPNGYTNLVINASPWRTPAGSNLPHTALLAVFMISRRAFARANLNQDFYAIGD